MFNNLAILSHILPPSPSGQAVTIYELLKGLQGIEYCLISHKNYTNSQNNAAATEKLPAKYFYLKPLFQLPVLNKFKISPLTLTINALWGIFNRARMLRNIIRKENINLLISCTGDLYDLPAAHFASKWSGIPHIPYIFDDYMYQWTGFRRLIAKMLEPRILKSAADIIVANEYMAEEYRRRYDCKSTVIHNSCQLPVLSELDSETPLFSNQETNIVYTGAVYHANYDAFQNLIAAFDILNRNDIKLHLYTAQSTDALKQCGIEGSMIVFHSHVNKMDMPRILRQADILFLPLAFKSPIPEVIRTSAPGKTGEYLSSAKPILVHAPHDSYLSWFFRRNSCGIVVDSADPILLSIEIERLISDQRRNEDLGKKARMVAEQEFDSGMATAEFVKLLNRIAERKYETS